MPGSSSESPFLLASWTAAIAAAIATGLAVAEPALATPANFGSPFNPPPRMFFALAGMQVQSDHSWAMSVGGAYGLTRFFSPSYSLARSSTGGINAGLGAAMAGDLWGTDTKLGFSASDTLESNFGPAYALALDWGRPLVGGLSTFGELGGGLSPVASGLLPGVDYDQSLDLALTSQVSVDVEYLGGLSKLGRSEAVCGDVTAIWGRTCLIGTVMVPRAPQAASPLYLLSTEFRMFP